VTFFFVEQLGDEFGDFVGEEPTDVEKDFATNAYWKYFTYDTFDPRTWVTLNDLESCLRTVKGGTVNPWVGADDLWEANVLPLGDEKMTSQKPGVVFFSAGRKVV